jgi:hypothetical protein
MQVFLPYKCFEQSAKVLDMKRLGKQRVEVLQLLNSITKIKNNEPYKGWSNHPCRKMWHNYSNALVVYGQAICKEWLSRGYKDTCYDKITSFYNPNEETVVPSFVGDDNFHESHRSMLIQKKPDFYRSLFPDTPDNLEYIWPV